MKKSYQQPTATLHKVETQALIAFSLVKGEGTLPTGSDGNIQMDVKEDHSLWDTEW